MPFPSRQDAYQWLNSQNPQGPCGLVIATGGFRHLFLIEDGDELLYFGMSSVDPAVTSLRKRPSH